MYFSLLVNLKRMEEVDSCLSVCSGQNNDVRPWYGDKRAISKFRSNSSHENNCIWQYDMQHCGGEWEIQKSVTGEELMKEKKSIPLCLGGLWNLKHPNYWNST